MNDDLLPPTEALHDQIAGRPRRAGFVVGGVAMATTALVGAFLFQHAAPATPRVAPAVVTVTGAEIRRAAERNDIPAPMPVEEVAAPTPSDVPPSDVPPSDDSAKLSAPAVVVPAKVHASAPKHARAHAPSAKHAAPIVHTAPTPHVPLEPEAPQPAALEPIAPAPIAATPAPIPEPAAAPAPAALPAPPSEPDNLPPLPEFAIPKPDPIVPAAPVAPPSVPVPVP